MLRTGGTSFIKIWNFLGARRVTRINFHVEDPKLLGFTVQNLVVMATWGQECVHLWRGGYDLYLLRKVESTLDIEK